MRNKYFVIKKESTILLLLHDYDGTISDFHIFIACVCVTIYFFVLPRCLRQNKKIIRYEKNRRTIKYS